MSVGLLAVVDDILSAAMKASAKAAGVVIDDAAVTPQYVQGLTPARELPVVGKIALGSVLLGLGYIGMVLAARVVPEGQRGGLHWLVSTTAITNVVA